MTTTTRLELSGHGTVEVQTSRPHPCHGPIVARCEGELGRLGFVWQRREIFALHWSRSAQAYIVDFHRGGGTALGETQVRNLIHSEPVDAGYSDGLAGRSSKASWYVCADRAAYERGFKHGRDDNRMNQIHAKSADECAARFAAQQAVGGAA